MAVTKGNDVTYITANASTLPDFRPRGRALAQNPTTLMDGVYDYYTGTHAGLYT